MKLQLNPNAAQWIRVLKSGRYRQADGKLKVDNRTYCALGLAIMLAKKAGVGVPESAWNQASLPSSVSKWLGLRNNSHDPRFTFNGHRSSVMEMNDTGKDFKTIASTLEAHAFHLFRMVRPKPRLEAIPIDERFRSSEIVEQVHRAY